MPPAMGAGGTPQRGKDGVEGSVPTEVVRETLPGCRNPLGGGWHQGAMLLLHMVASALRPRPQPWAHLLAAPFVGVVMLTCSPWGFPEMPRTSGSFMPDTVQGRARSVSSSCNRAPGGHISTVRPRLGSKGLPSAGGGCGRRSTRRPCRLSRPMSVGGSPALGEPPPTGPASARTLRPGLALPQGSWLCQRQVSGGAHTEGDPPGGCLKKGRVYSDETATVEAKPFLRGSLGARPGPICVTLGQ